MADVLLITETGFVYLSLPQEQCEDLADKMAQYMADQEEGANLRFIIELADGHRYVCKDILVCYRQVRKRGES